MANYTKSLSFFNNYLADKCLPKHGYRMMNSSKHVNLASTATTGRPPLLITHKPAGCDQSLTYFIPYLSELNEDNLQQRISYFREIAGEVKWNDSITLIFLKAVINPTLWVIVQNKG